MMMHLAKSTEAAVVWLARRTTMVVLCEALLLEVVHSS